MGHSVNDWTHWTRSQRLDTLYNVALCQPMDTLITTSTTLTLDIVYHMCFARVPVADINIGIDWIPMVDIGSIRQRWSIVPQPRLYPRVNRQSHPVRAPVGWSSALSRCRPTEAARPSTRCRPSRSPRARGAALYPAPSPPRPDTPGRLGSSALATLARRRPWSLGLPLASPAPFGSPAPTRGASRGASPAKGAPWRPRTPLQPPDCGRYPTRGLPRPSASPGQR